MRTASTIFVATIVAAALALGAAAPKAGEADPATIDKAKVLMEEGQSYFAQGKFNEAALAFMKAYSLQPFSAFLFNTAVCLEKLHLWKDAADFFERYLESQPNAPDKDKIMSRMADLRSRPEVPKGVVPAAELPGIGEIEKVACGGAGQAACQDLAKSFMEEGQAHFLAGRFNEAAVSFIKAYTVQPFPEFLFNAAVAYEKMKKWTIAADLFERYLETAPDAPDRDKILERIKDLRSRPEVPEEKPYPQAITGACGGPGQPACPGAPQYETAGGGKEEPSMKSLLNIRTTPAEATITVSLPDKAVATGSSPFTQTLEQGAYTISIEHPKYKTTSTSIEVKSGRIYVVVVEMSQGTFLGYLNVRTKPPGAKVYLDGKDAGVMGKTPWGKPVTTGAHKLVIEKAGYLPVEKDLDVQLGAESTVNVDLERVSWGMLNVKTNLPGSLISVDGAAPVQASLQAQLPAGEHAVAVKAKGMKPVKKSVALAKGMETTMLVRLNPAPNKNSAWISFGLMALFMTAGSVLSYYAWDLHRDMENDAKAGRLASDDARKTKGLVLAVVADASFLFGGITGILGIVYAARDPLPPSEVNVKEPMELDDIITGGK